MDPNNSSDSFDQLPQMLTAEDIAAVLCISRISAYALTHRADFPCLVIGRRRITPRESFRSWMNKQLEATL